MTFSTVLVIWLVISFLALCTLGVAIAYTNLRKRLPEACRYEHLQKLISDKSTELADLSIRLDDARKIIEQSKVATQELNVTREWMETSKDELLELKGQREEQEQLKAQIGVVQEELDTKRADLERISSERIVALSTVNALNQKHQALSEDFGRVTNEIKEAEAVIQRYRAEIATGEARNNALKGILAEQEQEISNRKSSIAQLISQHDSLLEQIRLSQLEMRSADAEATRAKQQAEIAKSELGVLHKRQSDLSENIDRLTQEIKDLEARRDDLARETSAAQKVTDEAVAEWNRVRTVLNNANEALAKITSEIAALRGSRDALQEQIKQMHAYLAELRGMVKETGGDESARYRDLWEPLSLPNLIKSNTTREQLCLENTQRHLQGVGLKFPARVLNAFHAALKSADMSPLVVLAGISGTGKSQLPKRYAEGMGIHFVPLAVQPRWDSPQDLFGFFNHLEKRYKATELARAMVQFERYTWKTWPEAHRKAGSHSKQMLLVLLDEMNLARVEYYFSELLSRLEFRRDIKDPATDEEARNQAEIRLDMGALADGEHEIRLYPDRNILFTGTMNEDESTQTLSDKVLDRACVLRFGRPRKLDNDSDPRRRSDEQQAEHGISLDQWMDWTNRHMSQAQADLVGSWTDELNEIMDKLHRPFGHRVAKSIHQYVTQYVDFSSNDESKRVKWAMADQIEQRILPKLRGIDLQSDETHAPLDQLRDLITNVEDMELKAAYEACRESGQRSGLPFMWRGLDRTA